MPMNVCAKPEPGIVTNGQLNDVAIAFESIVLPVPGAPRKSTPRSRLPPAFSNSSPDCQSETTRRDLLLGLGLAADVVELDAPVRVAGLVGLDLLDAEEDQRPEQDQEVDEERGRQHMP